MAYGIVFQGVSYGQDVRLYLNNYTGLSYTLEIKDARIRWTGADNGPFELIRTSRAVATFVLTEVVHKSLVLLMLQRQETEYVLQVGNWFGTVLQDQINYEDVDRWEVSIPAVDGLANDQATAQVPGNQEGTLAFWVYNLIEKVAAKIARPQILVSADLIADNGLPASFAEANLFFRHAMIGAAGWAGGYRDGVFYFYSVKKALENICYAFGLSLFYDGTYKFIHANRWGESNLNMAQFSNPDRYGMNDFAQRSFNREVTVTHRRAGGSFSFRPEYRQISQELNKASSAIIYTKKAVPPSNTYNVQFSVYQSISGFFLRIKEVSFIATGTGMYSVFLRIYLKTNGLNYNNNGSWTVGGFFDIMVGSAFQPGPVNIGPLDITVTGLPITTDYELRYQYLTQGFNTVSLDPTPILQDFAVDFEVITTKDFGKNAVILKDLSSKSSLSLEINSTDITVENAEFEPSRPHVVITPTTIIPAVPDFGGERLHQKVLKEIFYYCQQPIEVYEGDIVNTIVTPFSIVRMDNANYMVLDCEINYPKNATTVLLYKILLTYNSITVDTLTDDTPPLVSTNGGLNNISNIGFQGVVSGTIQAVSGSVLTVYTMDAVLRPNLPIYLANPQSGAIEKKTVVSHVGNQVTVNSAPASLFEDGSVIIIRPIDLIPLIFST